MDNSFVAATASEVRALIASLWLGENDTDPRVGQITLASHQRVAVARIRAAFEEFGGCLLCDVVGAGKTFVGAAIAARYPNPLIVAPAALRSMWAHAKELTHIEATFVSTESLSRRTPSPWHGGVLVVDEAHHFRNANTLRFGRLSRLAQGRPILLMTATPVHNAKRDLETLLGIFLGERARHLTESELGRLIVRREKDQIKSSAFIPEVRVKKWVTVEDNPPVTEAILSLPPPVPAREAGEARFLVAHGLLRQWASSRAAFVSALKRRLTQAVALESSLESGHHLTDDELRSWIADDETVQLNFAGLFAPQSRNTAMLIDSVRAHSDAIRSLLAQLRCMPDPDEQRAKLLLDIRARHSAEQIVAFASYEATARALFDKLSRTARVALLASAGGRVVGGRISRSEILCQFDPRSPPSRAAERIDLLVTTDLLSEGVNLQRAGVVVHLDLPWTPARLEQRVGRIARIGSSHSSVAVHGFSPPHSVETALRTCATLLAKWRVASVTVGTDGVGYLGGLTHDPQPSPAMNRERMREIVAGWRHEGPIAQRVEDRPLVAAVESDNDGFVALLDTGEDVRVVAAIGPRISEMPHELEPLLAAASNTESNLPTRLAQNAITRLLDWTKSQAAASSAGVISSDFLRTRRRSMRKLDAAALRIPNHVRSSRRELLESARSVLMSVRCHADEDEIEKLEREAEFMGDDEWLRRVTTLDPRQSSRRRDPLNHRIRAVIIFCSANSAPSS